MKFNKIIPVLDVLNKFTSRASEINDIRVLANEVERVLEEVIDVEYTGLYLFDVTDQKLKLYFARGFTDEERLEAERTALQRHPGHVFTTGQILYVPDTEKDNPAMSLDSQRSFRVRSRLTIPVFNAEKVVGVFSISSAESNRFTEEHIAVFSFLGNLAGSVYGRIMNQRELLRLTLIERDCDRTRLEAISRENSERKKVEHALKNTERMTRMIIDTAMDAYIMINSEGEVVRWNKHAGQIFGYTSAQAVGRQLADLIVPEEMKEKHARGLQNYLRTGAGPIMNKRVEMTAQHKNGRHLLVELAVNAVNIRNKTYFSAFLKDITTQKMAQIEQETTTSRITTLIQNLHAGILVENESRKIVLVNNQFCQLFNIPGYPESLIGKDCAELEVQSRHYLADPDAFGVGISRILFDQVPVLDEQIELADGRVFERDYLPIYTREKFMGNLWRYSDITPRKLAEADLKKAREEAISASIAKSQFLATMSHEIRTPLHAIYGLSRLLEETILTEEQKKLIFGLNSSAEGLLGIVNDVLDFTKIEAGQMELTEGPFYLEELVNNIFSSFDYKAEEKEIQLLVKFDREIRRQLLGDAIRLRQVLVNLMSNAIKFTQKGTVTIECRLDKSTAEKSIVFFRVTDTGIGIANENISRVFQSFQQEDAGTTRLYGGTGLGLAISRQLVELMGGHLQVTSKKGFGSEFFFTLPFKQAIEPIPDEIAGKEDLNPKSLEGLTVLLVEDNKLNQFIAKSILEKFHMAVTIANHGKEALDLLRRTSFDLVLMDLQMPEMGGLEATRLIRTELNLKLPVIALTANAVKGVVEECFDAGMNDYIVKPFNPDILANKIKELAGRRN